MIEIKGYNDNVIHDKLTIKGSLWLYWLKNNVIAYYNETKNITYISNEKYLKEKQ